MSIIDKSKALSSLYPIEEWMLDGDDLKWLDKNTPKPTDAEIDAEIIKLQAEYDALQYQRDRATSYPSVGDQLDMMMKDMKNGTTTHQEACEAVKAKYPKP